MNEPKRPVNIHKGYHAHVYFDEETVDVASRLCAEAGEKFGLKVGRVHQKLVGPHTKWSCQITFSYTSFDTFIPWLDEHRGRLSVLVHALTGDDHADHTTHAYWLEDSVEINLDGL
ncbi:DOPA 4,5-dioxygenase family protein [Halomonas caseinilytica]|uniref:DOPA 4,5-dioxygenase family protein n=1 Tax=Halomonas caseinilytica TaxID=438744 RepID=UPI0008492B83|nr:DOPA 4,5-dioxygenase family protein [Halomonas caseinilytica]